MPDSVMIDNLNTDILERLRVESQRRGTDVKGLILEVLQDKFGAAASVPDAAGDFDALAGTWSAEDASQFLAAIADTQQCDDDLWK